MPPARLWIWVEAEEVAIVVGWESELAVAEHVELAECTGHDERKRREGAVGDSTVHVHQRSLGRPNVQI
jgi:hypothetical protein